MRVRLVRRPGQHGTRSYIDQYGDRLICVRYRYDETTRRRYKTIEIIVEEKEWEPSISGNTLVGVRLKTSDRTSYEQLLTMREKWDAKLGVWRLRYSEVRAMGLQERIVGHGFAPSRRFTRQSRRSRSVPVLSRTHLFSTPRAGGFTTAYVTP